MTKPDRKEHQLAIMHKLGFQAPASKQMEDTPKKKNRKKMLLYLEPKSGSGIT